MRTLHGFGYDGDVLIIEELSFKIDWLVRPRLTNNFHALVHPTCRFFLAHPQLPVFMGLTAFAHAEIQPTIGNNIHHRVGLRHIEWIV